MYAVNVRKHFIIIMYATLLPNTTAYLDVSILAYFEKNQNTSKKDATTVFRASSIFKPQKSLKCLIIP